MMIYDTICHMIRMFVKVTNMYSHFSNKYRNSVCLSVCKMDKITDEDYMACGPSRGLLTKYYESDRVEDEMGGACGTNGSSRRAYRFW